MADADRGFFDRGSGLFQTRQRRRFAWEKRVMEDPRTVEKPAQPVESSVVA